LHVINLGVVSLFADSHFCDVDEVILSDVLN